MKNISLLIVALLCGCGSTASSFAVPSGSFYQLAPALIAPRNTYPMKIRNQTTHDIFAGVYSAVCLVRNPFGDTKIAAGAEWTGNIDTENLENNCGLVWKKSEFSLIFSTGRLGLGCKSYACGFGAWTKYALKPWSFEQRAEFQLQIRVSSNDALDVVVSQP